MAELRDDRTPTCSGVESPQNKRGSSYGRRSSLTLPPYVGPSWYHRVVVEFLLHHGIAARSDILLHLNATGRLPPGTLKEPLDIIERAWGRDVHLAKFSVNAMVGLWASTRTHSHTVESSTISADCPPRDMEGMLRLFEYDDQQLVIDHIYSTRMVDNSTMRPIHDLIMATEHVRMAQLYSAICKLGVPSRSIVSVKTDAFIIQAARKHLPKLKALAENVRNCDLHRQRELQDTKQTLLDEFSSLSSIAPITSEDPVFKFTENGRPLQGAYKAPKRGVPLPDDIPPWRDLTAEEARVEVLEQGQSLSSC